MKAIEFKKVVWGYTRKIADNMDCIFSPVGDEYGLTMLQIRILMELHHYGSHTIGSLADSICVAGTNISAMCKKLEAQGLLKRVRSQEDERVVKVILTEPGKKTVQKIDEAFNDRILQGLSNEAEESFNDIIVGLQKLNDILQRINRNSK
jgi:DNA-binding MarR family transcriptional regulator